MTDRYDERTREVPPSRMSILVGIVACWSALIATGYIGIGMQTGREYTGFFLGIVVSLLMIGGTISRIIDRSYAPPVRLAAEDDGEQEYEYDELAVAVADQFGPYEDQPTAVISPSRQPMLHYQDVSVPVSRHAAWLAPPTEVIHRAEGVTEVIHRPPVD